MSRGRAIPSTTRVKDENTRRILDALSETTDQLAGHRGNFLDSSPSIRQLVAAGVVGVRTGTEILFDPNKARPDEVTEDTVAVAASAPLDIWEVEMFT